MKIQQSTKIKAKVALSVLAAAALAVPAVGFATSRLAESQNSYARVGGNDAPVEIKDKGFNTCIGQIYLGMGYTDHEISDPYWSSEQLEKFKEIGCKGPDIMDLTGVDFSHFPNLRMLELYDSTIKSLSIQKTQSLEEIYLQHNSQLQTLDITDNNSLGYLNIGGHQDLKSAKINNNTSLLMMEVSKNQSLQSLDISDNPQLNEAAVIENRNLTALKVTNDSKLQEALFAQNALTDIDLSTNTGLQLLDVSGNKLTVINISKNSELQVLAADDIFVKSSIMTDQMAGAKDFDLSKLKFIGTIPNKEPIYTFDETTRKLSVADLEGTIDQTNSYGYVQVQSLPVKNLESWVDKVEGQFTYKLVLFEVPQPDVPVPHTGGETAGAPNTGMGSATTIVTAASIAVPTLIASLLVTRAIRNRKRGHLKFD